MKTFKVNPFITLKLEDGKTNIYIDGKLFHQCKFLLLEIPIEKIESLDEIESIDEASLRLDRSMERGYARKNINIPPETEFWGHCSNLQVWFENDYDTRLLHSNLAFPLLKKLTEAGDPLAKKVFKEEIAKRFSSGIKSVMLYLIRNEYLDYLNEVEIQTLIENFEYSPILLLESTPRVARMTLITLLKGDPYEYIKNMVSHYPLAEQGGIFYAIGRNIADIKLEITNFSTQITVKKSTESNVDLGIRIMELALDSIRIPEKLFETLPHLYGLKNRWDKAIPIYEKAIKQNKIKPNYIAGIFMAAFYTNRQDIIDKYLEISLNHKELLEEPVSLSNVIYALNRKEKENMSEIALKLTREYWNSYKSGGLEKELPSLWVNMTDAYIVADRIDEVLEELIEEILTKLKDMHPIIYENLAWYYLKK
ncbi:MAG: hypothetical protein ACFFBI_09735, partial [Promethearchaeota archaeon]